jgi:hypothetical protein
VKCKNLATLGRQRLEGFFYPFVQFFFYDIAQRRIGVFGVQQVHVRQPILCFFAVAFLHLGVFQEIERIMTYGRHNIGFNCGVNLKLFAFFPESDKHAANNIFRIQPIAYNIFRIDAQVFIMSTKQSFKLPRVAPFYFFDGNVLFYVNHNRHKCINIPYINNREKVDLCYRKN